MCSNEYYEVPKDSGRPRRLSSAGLREEMTDKEKNSIAQGHHVTAVKIPVEWQQWLRHSRKDPPEMNEILMHEAIRMRTQQRAYDKDRKHEQWKAKV